MSKNPSTKKAPKLTETEQHAKDRAEALAAAVGLLEEAKHIAADIFGRVVEPKLVIEMMPIFFYDDGERDDEDIENLQLAHDACKEAFGKEGTDPETVLAIYNYFDDSEEDEEEDEDYEDEDEDEDE